MSNIKKLYINKLTLEDFELGEGKVTQVRGGKLVTLTQVNASNFPVSGVLQNVNGIKDDIVTASAIKDDIVTTSAIKDDIVAASAIKDDIVTTSAIKDDIVAASTIKDDISTTSTIKDDISTTSAIKDDILKLNSNYINYKSDLDFVQVCLNIDLGSASINSDGDLLVTQISEVSKPEILDDGYLVVNYE